MEILITNIDFIWAGQEASLRSLAVHSRNHFQMYRWDYSYFIFMRDVIHALLRHFGGTFQSDISAFSSISSVL